MKFVNKLTLAIIFTASIWPCLAIFLISAIIFFSCCSILARSRSNSLMALFKALWFCLNNSSGVFLRPKSHSILKFLIKKVLVISNLKFFSGIWQLNESLFLNVTSYLIEYSSGSWLWYPDLNFVMICRPELAWAF